MTRGLLERYPFDSPWIRSVIAKFWLPTWFAANALAGIANALQDSTLLYFDARLYLDATRTWMAGGDPWSVSLAGNYYAAPPPSLLPLVPLAVLPPDLGVAVLAGLVMAAAIASVHLLRLPWWWILFPPLVQCVLSANVHALLLPLILLRGGGIATFLKVYAVVPLVILGRWWAVGISAAALLVTAPLLPWGDYLTRFPEISATLAEQTRFALPTIVLVAAAPFALLAMAMIGRERAAWLAVPALWPSQQYYYGSLAMGSRDPIAAAIVALPVPGSGLIAVVALAVLEWRRGARPAVPGWWSRMRSGPSAW